MKPVELSTEDKQVEERQMKKGFFQRMSVMLKPGQKIWELELKTGILKEATYEEANYNMETGTGHRRINEKPGYFYLPGINWKNAQRKFSKVLENKLLIVKERK